MVRPLARSLARVGALAFAVGCAATDYNVTKEAARLAVTPGLVDLGAVSPGTENAAIVRLTHIAGADAIRIVSLNVLVLEGDGFTVVDPGVATIEPEASVDVTVLWAPGADGLHLGRLEIATDEVEDSRHTVDVRGSVGAGTLRAFPPVLDFGPVGVGDDAVATITIENAGTAELTLSAPTLDAPGFSTTWAGGPLAAGTRVEVPVSFVASADTVAEGLFTAASGSASVSVQLRANACADGDPSLYDTDGDGWALCAGDCDDRDAGANPAGVESCDGADQDCDGVVDEGTSCFDDDGDGITEDEGDCDDATAATRPGATEDLTNGRDDDCDGVTDLGNQDYDGDGFGTVGGDCDDFDAGVHPGAPEDPDGADDDCDGIIDEGTEAYDDDGDGLTERDGDCNDGDASVFPGAVEAVDGIDEDCDGVVDDGTTAHDDDGDGFSEAGGDCDDANPAVNPSRWDTLGDGLDNDCDGTVR